MVAAMRWFNSDEDTIRGMTIIGAMVRRRRVRLGWSQRYLAERSGISQSVISRLETANIKGMKIRRFACLVSVMGGLDPSLPPPAPARRQAPVDVEPRPLPRIDLTGGMWAITPNDDRDVGDEPLAR
jgi:hypothetical protein